MNGWLLRTGYAAGLLALAGVAEAATITTTYNGTGSITFLDNTLPLTTPVPTSGSVSFPSIAKFDTNLGTLNDIKFQLSGNGNVPNAGASFVLVSAASGTTSPAVPVLTFTIGGTVAVTLPGGSPTAVSGILSGNGSSTAITPASFVFTSTGSFGAAVSGPIVTTTNAIDFGQFSAAGGGIVSSPTVTITPIYGQSPSFSTPITISTLQLVQGVDLTVTYDYTPNAPPVGIPDPISLGLFGIALLGLGLARRRID